MTYKVLITTSGVGSRLGELTRYTNKALVRAGKKPAISYIIESYPKDTEYVITLGHFGNQVVDFLTLAYPERRFRFVEVDNYDGRGSSLGYSLLQAKKFLNCPFIYHASDTIIDTLPPKPTKNWIGVHRGTDSSQYASWQMNGSSIMLQDKGAIDFEFLHIGLTGVHDFKNFWSTLEALYVKNPNDPALNDCAVIVRMAESGAKFDFVEFPMWLDMGNIGALRRAREVLANGFNNLDKLEEEIFLFDTFVIKFFSNEKTLASRVQRARHLKGLVPKIQGAKKNFYRYAYAKGDLYSSVATVSDFPRFLGWAKKNLWKPVREVSEVEFKDVCRKFYKEKTEERIKKLLAANSLTDKATVINGELVPSVRALLARVDFDRLTTAPQSQFHGDFILDNIIKTRGGYCLLDWRQDFGGLLRAGDIYYDLAKLNHNLTVNHALVGDNHFTVEKHPDGSIRADILTKASLVECKQELRKFIEREGLDYGKVSLLTALIWLNMSPLHHHPFNLFLFYFGKYHLWKALHEKR